MIIDAVPKLIDRMLAKRVMRFPYSVFFPESDLAGNTVTQVGLHQNGLEFFTGLKDLIIGSKIVYHHSSNKRIHRVELGD